MKKVKPVITKEDEIAADQAAAPIRAALRAFVADLRAHDQMPLPPEADGQIEKAIPMSAMWLTGWLAREGYMVVEHKRWTRHMVEKMRETIDIIEATIGKGTLDAARKQLDDFEREVEC